MLPLFLLMFVPAATIAAGLLAYNILHSDIEDLDYDAEDDHISQMFGYYDKEKK